MPEVQASDREYEVVCARMGLAQLTPYSLICGQKPLIEVPNQTSC